MRSSYQDIYRQQESKMRQQGFYGSNSVSNAPQQSQQQQLHSSSQQQQQQQSQAIGVNSFSNQNSNSKGIGQRLEGVHQSQTTAYANVLQHQRVASTSKQLPASHTSQQSNPNHQLPTTITQIRNPNNNNGFSQQQQQQQMYSHSSHVSANHSRENSMNRASMSGQPAPLPERKISLHSSKPSTQDPFLSSVQQKPQQAIVSHSSSHSTERRSAAAAAATSAQTSFNSGRQSTPQQHHQPTAISNSNSNNSSSYTASSTYQPHHQRASSSSTMMMSNTNNNQQQLQVQQVLQKVVRRQQQSQEYQGSSHYQQSNDETNNCSNQQEGGDFEPKFYQPAASAPQHPAHRSYSVSGSTTQQQYQQALQPPRRDLRAPMPPSFVSHQPAPHASPISSAATTPPTMSSVNIGQFIPQQHIQEDQSVESSSSSTYPYSAFISNNSSTHNHNNSNVTSINSTEKKPASFLNYLMLKEIAQRNSGTANNNLNNSTFDQFSKSQQQQQQQQQLQSQLQQQQQPQNSNTTRSNSNSKIRSVLNNLQVTAPNNNSVFSSKTNTPSSSSNYVHISSSVNSQNNTTSAPQNYRVMINNFNNEHSLINQSNNSSTTAPSSYVGISDSDQSYNPAGTATYLDHNQQQFAQSLQSAQLPHHHKQSRSEIDAQQFQNYMYPASSHLYQQPVESTQLQQQYPSNNHQHYNQAYKQHASQPPSPQKQPTSSAQPIGQNTTNYLMQRKTSINAISSSQKPAFPNNSAISSTTNNNLQYPVAYNQQQLPNTPNTTQRSLVQMPKVVSDQRRLAVPQVSVAGISNESTTNITQTAAESTEEEMSRSLLSSACSSKNQFHYHYVIGKGGFGKVWKVEHRKTRQLFAMKEMSKSLVITKKSVNSVMNERTLLSQLKNPFLVNMFYAFHDRESLHLVMDLMPGGDLRYHIGRQRRFSEEQTRFFVACIFMGLEYLHNNNIIHRDIKPENLVLDSSGYVRITDLGIAREWKLDNANDTSGTPGYMAPEVMCRQPHTFAVDYFALGVLAYEFMLGRRPYLGRSRKEIRDQILAKRVQIKKNEIPDGWSLEAADFINRLIERKPSNRLGINGPAEVKAHPWIKNFPWQKLYKKQIPAPFLPANEDNFDQKQQITVEDEQSTEVLLQNAMLLKRPSVQSLFNGYNFDGGMLLLQGSSSSAQLLLENQHESSISATQTNRMKVPTTSIIGAQPTVQVAEPVMATPDAGASYTPSVPLTQYKLQQPTLDLKSLHSTSKNASPAIQRPPSISNSGAVSSHSNASATSYSNPFTQRSNSIAMSSAKDYQQQQQQLSYHLSGLKSSYQQQSSQQPQSHLNSLNSSRNYSNSLNQSHQQVQQHKENMIPQRYAFEDRR